MKKLLAADEYLIEIVQSTYLWLWDRTGVYVASILFVLIVVDHVCYGPLGPFDFTILAIVGAWATYLYVAQAKDLRQLNLMQRAWAGNWFRLLSVILTIAALATALFDLNYWRLASNAAWLAFTYFACVQVRDRDPKDFITLRKLAGAT